ncbi:MAG TPA: saccharopine dehydrogenase NADP-binding domain-containing protein [Saprospiraceae bacterium]|nr:saccharopine dehydrogenase NADP-binding domain-containing protein [Saprospiraceae bacterium]
MTQDRKYDIVVWGATGFTGNYVAEYLASYSSKEDIRWAIAGRDINKLKLMAEKLGHNSIPIIQADINNAKSMNAMAASTKVICSTAGPFAILGTPVIEACIREKTDYCDITGETHWIKKIIERFHDQALADGLKIVHCCGFDSIPSDMGVYQLQKESFQKFGEYCHTIKMRVRAAKGKLSGGTYASMRNIMEDIRKDPSLVSSLKDPYSLNPANQKNGPPQRDLDKVIYDKELSTWIAPFVMEAINTRIVRRSHALRNAPYGHEFKYNEAIMTGKGLRGKMKGIAITIPLAVMMAARPGNFFNGILNRFLPKPGDGPTEKEVRAGFYILNFYGFTLGGKRMILKWKGNQDPGYGSTSMMLAQSAICLAKDRSQLPNTYGVLTPSVAMEEKLMDRLLSHAEIKVEIKD